MIRPAYSLVLLSAATLLPMSANASQDLRDAYQSCKTAIANEIGVRRYSTFDRKFAKLKLENGDYRFFMNTRYRHPELDGVYYYRSMCESGGLGRLNVVRVKTGEWAINELANNPIKAREALLASQ